MTRLRDARLSARFASILTYVLGTVAASILVNLASTEWGWPSLWLVLAVAVWIACIGWLVSLPLRSPLRETAAVGLIAVLAIAFAATARVNSDFALDPGFKGFMLTDAAIMAVVSLTLAVVLPGWLRTWDGMSFTFATAFIAISASHVAMWPKAILAVVVLVIYVAGFLTLYPRTAPAMGRYGRRLRRAWLWLITERSDRAPNRRRRPPHASPGRRKRAPIGSRTQTVRRPRTMREPR